MTQAIPGYDGQIYVSDDGGSNYIKIGEIRDMTLNVENEDFDATSHDSNGWRERIYGLRNWGLSGGNVYVYNNPGQVSLIDALIGAVNVKVKFRPKDSSSLPQYTGDAVMSTTELNAPTDDIADSSFEILGTAAITKGTI